MNALNDLLLRAFDFLLGWMLMMPRWAGLIALGVLTALILVLIRPAATNQNLLRRCAEDRRRLRRLMRSARRRRDKEALRCFRATRAMVSTVAMRAELRPLLYSIVPIALVAVWAFQRMPLVPPGGGEPLHVTASMPLTSDGKIIHLVPQEGLVCDSPFVQQAKIAPGGQCEARWTVRLDGRPELHVLEFRVAGRTCKAMVRAGQPTYEPPVTPVGDDVVDSISVRLEETRLWRIGGIDFLGLPAWLTGYFLVSLGAVVLLKRLLRIR